MVSFISGSANSDLLCDLVYKHNLCQLVHVPTHVRGNFLDLVLTNCPDLVEGLRTFINSNMDVL